MVYLKTQEEINLMKKAGRISARALELGGKAVKPGVTTMYVDKIIHDYIKSQGAVPSFLGYNDFPASSCISINKEVIHGIPSKTRVINEGDIVSIDVGAYYRGFHADNAATFPAGAISEDAQKLINATMQALEFGIKQAVVGNRIGDISNAVQTFVESKGYGVVREYVGHGVGRKLHENPSVPNYGSAGRGMRLEQGMTIAIEPMVNMGSYKVKVLDDCWTVITADNKYSAHFEHTIAITNNGPEILTLP